MVNSSWNWICNLEENIFIMSLQDFRKRLMCTQFRYSLSLDVDNGFPVSSVPRHFTQTNIALSPNKPYAVKFMSNFYKIPKFFFCLRCSNYIVIPDLAPGFNGRGKDNWRTRQEIFIFFDLVRLILEVWRYVELNVPGIDSLDTETGEQDVCRFHSVSNHRLLRCLSNCLFGRSAKKLPRYWLSLRGIPAGSPNKGPVTSVLLNSQDLGEEYDIWDKNAILR